MPGMMGQEELHVRLQAGIGVMRLPGQGRGHQAGAREEGDEHRGGQHGRELNDGRLCNDHLGARLACSPSRGCAAAVVCRRRGGPALILALQKLLCQLYSLCVRERHSHEIYSPM